MQTDQFAALLTPDGAAALVAATEATEPEPLAVSTRLRAAGHHPGLVTTALTQVRLRRRAVAKFGPDAARMYFTVEGLEQATRAAVAARRAHRFVRAGVTTLADLGCGIGADLVACARAGLRVTGVERDPLTAAVARANLAALRLTDRAQVVCADTTGFDLTGFDGVFCDPARRSGGRRVFAPDAYSPPWSFLLSVAAEVPACALKVAPGLDHDRVPDGVEAEWVSEGGEVVEAGLWFGPLSSARHRATVLPAGASASPAGRWPEADSLTGSG
ncbi:MAG TPA: methyltransferase domain-containing protein, partial [Cryptosporangiaceae bacterium]|nr:methyltransferase domain-containing protein [Cryptosporangiaceae bacterium]